MLFFSRSTPSLAAVIPAMDHIEEVLNGLEENPEYDVAIQEAVSIARKTLNQYYSLTDSSDVYRISISTSPPF
jgi:hypothetical protein